MSTYANPENAYVWSDGDAFRGVAGATMPEDPFAETILGFEAFGGIEAGIEPTSEQSATKKHVFNYRKSAYKVARGPLSQGIRFRAVDNTMATALTRSQGGKVTKVGQHYTLEQGEGEEFSLLIRLTDGADKMVLFSPRVTTDGAATRANIDGVTIDGWEFNFTAIEPFVEILPGLPEGMEEPTP